LSNIELQNCRIREFTDCDLEVLADIEFDCNVKRFVGIPEGTKEDWVSKFKAEEIRGWAIEALPDKELAGRVYLGKTKERVPGIGSLEIIISDKFWGRRLGREVAGFLIPAAFSDLKALALEGEVHPDNVHSLNLLRAFGFRYLRNSQKEPMQIYQLTREEYGVQHEI